jgi:nucleoid-associated protein YgaU
MSFSRYTRDDIIKAGTSFGTATAAEAIKDAVNDGTLEIETRLIEEAERLDTIAGQVYNDGTLWWIIAAASEIGWGLQVPPGTVLRIPISADSVKEIVG